MRTPSIAVQWGAIRRVYPIYTAVAEEFALGPGPYPNLDELAPGSEEEAIVKVQAWLGEMDELIQPHQFRYILERTDILASEDRLRVLVLRYLNKDPRSDSDREKLHYLLNQYIFVCGPPSFRARGVSLEDVAQVLEPVLGEGDTEVPEWLQPLCRLVVEMPKCISLQQLQSSILAPGRDLKNGEGEQYFSTAALLVFTHFNYCARRTFTHLLDAELQAIENAVRELDSAAIEVVDCSSAGLGAQEPLANIRQALDELRTSTSPAYSCGTYSSDAVVQRIQALRAAVEDAVHRKATVFTDSDERRIAAMETQIQQLSAQLAKTSVELSGLRKIVARLVAQPQPSASSTLQGNHNGSTPAVIAAEATQNHGTPPVAPEPSSAPSGGSPDIASEVQRSIDEIRRALLQPGKTPSGVVKFGPHTVVLTAGEVEAMNSPVDVAATAQQAIATRALLMKFVENAGSEVGDVSGLADYARKLLADLQQSLGSNTVPMRDALASSARQLRTVLQHAEQVARKARLAQIS